MVDSPSEMKKTFSVPEIKPLDQYDLSRAKICASVRWLLSKSYGSAENVPVELRDPLYKDQYEQEHLKPAVSKLLLSPEIYCRVQALLARTHGVSPPASQDSPADNSALLQLLIKKGFTPKVQDVDVTEEDLSKSPIKTVRVILDAFAKAVPAGFLFCLPLISLSKLYSTKFVLVLHFSIRTLFDCSSLMSASLAFFLSLLRIYPHLSRPPQCPLPFLSCLPLQIRYRKDKVNSKLTPTFPLISAVKDLSNGCAVAAVIHFYCPSLLPLEDVCLKDTMSVTDSLHNLQLIKEFCSSSLQSCCLLAVEDLLYAPPAFRPLSAVTFSIPFGLDSDVDIVMGNPIDSVFRSVSTDSLSTGIPVGYMASATRPEPRLRPEGAPAGFFLHSPQDDNPQLSSSAPCRTGVLFRQPAAPGEESSAPTPTTPGTPHTPSTPAGAPGRQDSPGPRGPEPGSEAWELGARLEEKRKSIEAQKRRIEAIFAKHRQRLGKTAFLQLQREQGEGGGEGAEDISNPRLEKQVTFSIDSKKEPEKEKGAEKPNETVIVEYNEVVQKLSEALQSLQKDMQKLTEQQQQLMTNQRPKNTPKPAAWVIPASSNTPPACSPSRRSHVLSSSASPKTVMSSSCPAPRTKIHTSSTPRSPKNHSRLQHQPHPRPSELKFPPLNRVLTPTQNVDTLPHLRRVSPSKCHLQTSSTFRIAAKETAAEPLDPIERLNLATEENDVPEQRDERQTETSEITREQNEVETRGGIGFFFKEDGHSEDEMAQRRALLLERQQKRTEEIKRRRQWHEQDRENRPASTEKRTASPCNTPPRGTTSPSPTPPATPGRRGEFTRGEYARRQQLRIMDDLDKVLKQKSTNPGRPANKKTRSRPRSMTREETQLSLSPAKGATGGSKLTKIYSHSSLNLAATNEPGSKGSDNRPDSPSKCVTPSRLINQNGDKDSDSGSNGTSPAPEYTGPKLFKEPSFKSNKFIIHNALSRCCLAGKVNETQKNKIVEEMEKSPANHFLILFRDSSCQFRGVYTMNPDSQELVRLTGVGPRTVSSTQVESIYKYSSDRKQFSAIPSKTMGMSVDAFTIPGHLWQGGAGGAGGGGSRRASITKKAVISK
uniref:Calmodulin regulated spectrin associated protein family member 3 n=1 Tax=Salarias fasciatus TaxID=181472 RepID=A0A672FRH1_SALFA